MSLKLPTNLSTPAAYDTFRDDAMADLARLNRRAAQLGYAAPSGMLFHGRPEVGFVFWCKANCCDPEAFGVFRRHYTFNPRANHASAGGRFVGPGSPLVLITPESDAIFGWRKFIDDCIDPRTGQRQQGVNCAFFRNEGPLRSSLMILEAERLAWQKWPGQRLYTYVNPECILSENPGYCFKCAGWTLAGKTKGGLLILEKLCADSSDIVQRLADGMAAEQAEDGEDEDRLIRLGERGDVAGEEL